MAIAIVGSNYFYLLEKMAYFSIIISNRAYLLPKDF